MSEDTAVNILQDCSAPDSARIEAAVKLVFSLEPLFSCGGAILTAHMEEYHTDRVYFSVYTSADSKTGRLIGAFSLQSFPACTSIVISVGCFVAEEFKGMGYGKALNKLRVKAMSLAGFERILATVRDDNEAEKHILMVNGWTRLTTFNSNIGRTVSMWERVL